MEFMSRICCIRWYSHTSILAYFQSFIALCGGNLCPRDFKDNPNASGSGDDWNLISYTFWDYQQGVGSYLTGSAFDLWATLLALFLGLLVAWGIQESVKFNNF